jgi:hypothetical protein
MRALAGDGLGIERQLDEPGDPKLLFITTIGIER